MKSGNTDFEINFFERLIAQDPNFVDALIPLAEAYTRKGVYDKGLAIDKRLARLRKDDPYVHYNLACSYALLGKKKEAIRSLERAIQRGYSDFAYLKRDGDLKSLHSDPKFKALMASAHFHAL